MRNLRVSFFLIKSAKCLIHPERIFKILFQKYKGVFELTTIIIHFHHTFHHFQPQNLPVGQPGCGKHLIRFPVFVKDLIFSGHLHHMRTLQHFQKTKLKLLRPQCIDIAERLVEAFISLIGKSCDQIQMLVDISKAVDLLYDSFQFFKIHGSPNSFDGLRIGGLYPDLQLDQARAHGFHQSQFLLTEKVRGNFKMEVRDPVVMLCNIPPDCHGVVMFTVEGTVHKFDLWNFIINKKLQFFFYKFNIPEPELLIYGRKTVTAGKWTSPAALIINNAVFKLRKVAVCKRNFT